jgi:hypothetical protein
VSLSWKIIPIVKFLRKCRFCLLYRVYGKMVLFDRELWIGAKSVRHVRPRTPNSRDCGRKPVNKYPAVEFQGFSVCRTLKEQGLHPYHVQRVQAWQPNDCIRRQEFCEWAIQKCVDQPDFLRMVLFTNEAGFTPV